MCTQESKFNGKRTVEVVCYFEELLFLYVLCPWESGGHAAYVLALHFALTCFLLFSLHLFVSSSGVLGTLYQCTDSFNYSLLVPT